MMKVVCAWCGEAQESKPCGLDMVGSTSHGVCHVCYAKQVLPGLCDEISRASYDRLLCFLLSEGWLLLDETSAKGLRELCRRRQQVLQYEANKPVDYLSL